jgi:hypothetical protein
VLAALLFTTLALPLLSLTTPPRRATDRPGGTGRVRAGQPRRGGGRAANERLGRELVEGRVLGLFPSVKRVPALDRDLRAQRSICGLSRDFVIREKPYTRRRVWQRGIWTCAKPPAERRAGARFGALRLPPPIRRQRPSTSPTYR